MRLRLHLQEVPRHRPGPQGGGEGRGAQVRQPRGRRLYSLCVAVTTVTVTSHCHYCHCTYCYGQYCHPPTWKPHLTSSVPRWPIKRYSHGPLSQYTAFHGVQVITNYLLLNTNYTNYLSHVTYHMLLITSYLSLTTHQ